MFATVGAMLTNVSRNPNVLIVGADLRSGGRESAGASLDEGSGLQISFFGLLMSAADCNRDLKVESAVDCGAKNEI